MTFPNTTCSSCAGSNPARSMAARAAVAPSSLGETSRSLRPKAPPAARAAELIPPPVICPPSHLSPCQPPRDVQRRQDPDGMAGLGIHRHDVAGGVGHHQL